jgi:ElaB/YqjD/DUF883 family membrane-anchored ribosome-binding protein
MGNHASAVDGPLVDGARSVEAAAGRLKDRVVTGSRERLDSSREYISENPVKSVLVAVGVGALVGYLLGRRSG